MKSRKKSLALGAILVVLLLVLVGCAAPTPETITETIIETVVVEKEGVTVIETVEVERIVEVTPVPEEPPDMGPVKIVIFVGFGTGTSPEQQAVHAEIQELYNSTHDNIQIEFLTVPWAERITKYSTMLAADQPPDILLPIGVGGISEFYKGWLDLTPMIEADNYDMSRYAGKTVDIHNYPGQGVLGLPLCVYPTGIFYNVDVFDAAGVDYPPAVFGDAYADGDDWTYDKMREIAQKLSLDGNGNDATSPAFDAENIVQFGWNGWDWGNAGDFTIHFGDLPGTGVSLDGTESLMLTDQYVAAYTFWKENVWDYHIHASGEQSGAFYQNAGDPMGSGMIGMWETHSWMSWAYDSWSENFAWNVAAVPAGPNGEIIDMVDADTAVIPAASKHPEEAWEVVKWLFEPEQYDRLIANYGCLPADKVSMARWSDEQKAKWPGVDFEVFLDALDYVETVNHEAWKPNYARVNDVMDRAKGEISSGTNLDVEAVLQAANDEIQQLLDEYWAANP
jgi:multiple sugar transport system substrate-binding protein